MHISNYLPSLEDILTSRGTIPELSLNMTPELNSKIWGIKKRQLTVIGARTSQGKSAIALQIAHDLSRQGHAVLFLSLEMTTSGIMERLFCHTREVDNELVERNPLSRYRSQFEQFKTYCDGLNLVVNDCIGKKWDEIDSMLTELHTKPAVIIVDYIQTIAQISGSKKEVIDEYIRHFRELAVRKDFAAIICSQVNRTSQETNDKKPALHQLKSSGFLEEHPDVVMLLHWPHKYDANKPKNEYHLEVAKNRNGRTGYVKLLYSPQHYLFKDWSEMEAKRMEAYEQKGLS